MSKFSDEELAYLAKGLLGRLATIDDEGIPHVVPLGWTYNAALDTIDVGGRDFAHTRKFRNVQHNPNVALVVDDVLPPWLPRCVLIRGRADALEEAFGAEGKALGPIVRITPTQVISWGMDVVDGEPSASG
jgi:pyridoxamine 5'-phosphate oxidase family protein